MPVLLILALGAAALYVISKNQQPSPPPDQTHGMGATPSTVIRIPLSPPGTSLKPTLVRTGSTLVFTLPSGEPTSLDLTSENENIVRRMGGTYQGQAYFSAQGEGQTSVMNASTGYEALVTVSNNDPV